MTQTPLTQAEAAEAKALHLSLCNVLHGAQTRVILSGLAMTTLTFFLVEDQNSGTDAVARLDEFHRKVRDSLVAAIQIPQEDAAHARSTEGPTIIEALIQSGRSIADRLMLRDALDAHYEILIASDGSDVTGDFSVTPSAMIWIHDHDQAAVVIAVQHQNTDAEYLTQVLIRPYTRDAGGRRILCEPLPKNHRRCQVAAKEAVFALCIHMAERRCRATSDRPAKPRVLDYADRMPPQGDVSLLLAVRERVRLEKQRGGP